MMARECRTRTLYILSSDRFTNEFLRAIQIRYKLRLVVIQLLAIRSQQCSVQATTAQLSSQVHNFVAIIVLQSRGDWNEISSNLNCDGKTVSGKRSSVHKSLSTSLTASLNRIRTMYNTMKIWESSVTRGCIRTWVGCVILWHLKYHEIYHRIAISICAHTLRFVFFWLIFHKFYTHRSHRTYMLVFV